MNFQIIKRTLGWILLFEAIFLLVPTITAICYGEKEVYDFLLCIAVCGALGGCCFIGKVKNQSIYAKEGYIITAMSWIILSLFGALPFWFSGIIPSYVDALFEIVSGFTTTGATILTGEQLDALPKCMLMWRSFSHWIGGMGVLVFIMALLPLSGAKNMHIMKAESPGPTVGKLVPKVKETASILYKIYAALTLIMFIFLVFGDMSLFDAVTTAFATAGTGGFANTSAGFANYSTYTQVVVTVFMVLFAINFTSFYFILMGKLKDALTTEVITFLCIVFGAIALITANLSLTSIEYGYTFGETIKHVAFSVASVVSSTGFATVDFNLWPSFSKTILVLLMFVGACAGSTGGGMKVSRFIVIFKGMRHEMSRMLHPRQVKKITLDKHIVEHEVVRGINSYLAAYIAVFIVSLLLISLDGFDLTTSFTSVLATINNIGPGLEMVGPAGNFAAFSPLSKLVFIFDMIAGRLELFPMLLLFSLRTWKK